VLRAEAADLQPGDPLGVQPIKLLGQQPHRLQAADRQGLLDDAEQRRGADPP